MPTLRRPRRGSLQYWPRKRAKKFLPRVNWVAIKADSDKKLKGFICYKAGMMSAIVKDNTPNSMTKGKIKALPVTILVCPSMKIFSTRFYKNNKVVKEILNENLDKELKSRLKLPKKKSEKLGEIKIQEYDDVSAVVYSQVKKTGLKKTPDLSEIGLQGNIEEKLLRIKENMNKEISINDIFNSGEIVDIRGLTKGKGLQGPTKRFGLGLKQHKSEKGVRRPGSLGPWHPARVTFRAPIAGQMGMFTRIVYNNKILSVVKASDKKHLKNLKNYGNVDNDYILVNGSIQGPVKRQLL